MIKFIIAVCLHSATTLLHAAKFLGLSSINKVTVRSGNGRALLVCDEIIHSCSDDPACLAGFLPAPAACLPDKPIRIFDTDDPLLD